MRCASTKRYCELTRKCRKPDCNLGNALLQSGRVAEAKAQYEQALRLKPEYAEAHNSLGILLIQLGQAPEAAAQFEEALRLKPDYAAARNNLSRLQALPHPAASNN